MKKLLWVAALFLLVMGTTSAANAQRIWWNDHDTTIGEVRSFDGFLDQHPRIAAELRSNPGLANNPNWLARHPEMREYLSRHPGVRQELHENPWSFVNKQRIYDRNEWRFAQRNDRRWDRDDWRFRR